MSFKNSPRLVDADGLDARKYPDVAGISSDQAQKAPSATSMLARDSEHQARLARAKKVDDPDVEKSLGTKEIPAAFKIEVTFGPGRTALGPNSCVVQFWESGRRLHGGGDDLMYMCKDRATTKLGCGALFSSDFVTGPFATCPKCKAVISADACVRRLVFRHDKREDYRIETKKLAWLLARYWREKLSCNADVYLKFDKTDIRYQAAEKKLGPRKGHELKGLSIYPLKNILADTANGGSLEDRIFAFLTA